MTAGGGAALDGGTGPRRGLWRDGDFMRLWAGQAVSSVGSQITVFVVPSLAILVLHAAAWQVGVLVALNRVAYPLLGLPAGVLVDRLPRRPLMIACNAAQAVVLLSIPVAYLLGGLNLAVLYFTTGVAGIGALMFDVAYRAYLPTLVCAEELTEGNARLASTDTAAQIAGPGLAGFLTQVLRAPLLILADVASFVFAAVMLLFIRGDRRPAEMPARTTPRGGFRREIAEGLRYVYRHPLLRPMTAYTGVANLGNAIIGSVFMLYAYRVAHLAPGTVGIVLGLGSVGALAGTFLARPAQRRYGIGRTLVGSSLVGGVGRLLLIVTTASAAVPLIALSWLSFGVTLSIFNINQTTVGQAAVPERLRGRAGATTKMVVWGTLPIGALLGGVLAQSIGVVPALAAGCLVRIVATPLLARPAVLRVGGLADVVPSNPQGVPV